MAFPGHRRRAESDSEAEIRRLLRELAIARQERDILKQAAACFANAENRGSSSSATTGSPSRWA